MHWEMLLRRDSHWGIRDSLGTLWDAANEGFTGLSSVLDRDTGDVTSEIFTGLSEIHWVIILH